MSAAQRDDLVIVPLHVLLAGIADGDVLTNYPCDFDGEVVALRAAIATAVTTASDESTLTVQINATDVPGTALNLTSANATPMGKVLEAEAKRRGGHKFSTRDTLSIVASDTTAFAEGAATLHLVLRRLS